ncbi:MAG: hypothetical protein AAGG11_21855 [Pseudomonadota bacterium]
MPATRYAISWLYGEFRIATFRSDSLVAQWSAPALVETERELRAALESAAASIDLSKRGDVTIVHEHDTHTHDYLEVPAMRRRDLEKYLLRRVEQDKSFDEAAAWCYHPVKHNDTKQGVLLHLLPKRIVDSTVSACSAYGLAPKRYVPLTEIVTAYLPNLGLATGQLVLVVACFTTRTEIILALGNGEALFVRELNYGQSIDNVARLTTDINRTVRYAQQQLHRKVDLSLMMGSFDPMVADTLRSVINIPVEFDEESTDPLFWASRSQQLTGKLSANFISVFAQQNLTRETFERLGVWSLAASALLAVGSTTITTGLTAHRAEQIEQIEERSVHLETVIRELEEKLRDGLNKQQHLERLRATTHNLPSLFMLHLSDLTPKEITLTNVDVRLAENAWIVDLAGRVTGDMRRGARALARFERDLQQPPWSLGLTDSFTRTWMAQFEQGKLERDGDVGFEIAGVLR